MIKKCFIFTACIVSLLAGCQKEKSDLDQITNIRGGNCLLKKDTDSFICIDYAADSDPNTDSSNCDTEYTRYNSSPGLNGKSWTSGTNNTCATSTSTTVIGTCARNSDGASIRYYGPHFTSGNAQTDCTSVHGGTWTP